MEHAIGGVGPGSWLASRRSLPWTVVDVSADGIQMTALDGRSSTQIAAQAKRLSYVAGFAGSGLGQSSRRLELWRRSIAVSLPVLGLHSDSMRARLFNVYWVETCLGGSRCCDRIASDIARNSWSDQDQSRFRRLGRHAEKGPSQTVGHGFKSHPPYIRTPFDQGSLSTQEGRGSNPRRSIGRKPRCGVGMPDRVGRLRMP